MGRQIQVALTYEDEQLFLSFLKEASEIVLLESFAPTKEGLWKELFEQQVQGHWTYRIWNKEFPWEPEYGQSTSGTYYVSNKGAAPLIEFTRSDIGQGKYGRIYWAKYFSAPNGLDYDVDKFSKWYDSVVKWIRKSAEHKMKNGSVNTYFLPNAWGKHRLR